MSSFDRRAILLSLTALAGCGFSPALAPEGGAGILRGNVRVADPTTRDEFDLANRVTERLGPPNTPRFTLVVDLEVEEDPLAITPEQVIERYNVVGRVKWQIRSTADDGLLALGSENNFTSYSATGTAVSTLSSQADARARLMTALADQIVTRLLATAPEWANDGAAG